MVTAEDLAVARSAVEALPAMSDEALGRVVVAWAAMPAHELAERRDDEPAPSYAR